MTKTLTGTWLAEVRDDSLWDSEPYYPSLDEGSGMVLNGEWTDARWALLNHLSEELANVTSQTCGPCEVVDPDGSFDRLETRLVSALKSLRKADYSRPWEFQMDGCSYRIFVAGRSEEWLRLKASVGESAEAFATGGADGADEGDSVTADAFAAWVSPHIAIFGEAARRRRPRRVGSRATGPDYRQPPA
jgi:hypothetical protein